MRPKDGDINGAKCRDDPMTESKRIRDGKRLKFFGGPFRVEIEVIQPDHTDRAIQRIKAGGGAVLGAGIQPNVHM